jgi:hypothetical protein
MPRLVIQRRHEHHNIRLGIELLPCDKLKLVGHCRSPSIRIDHPEPQPSSHLGDFEADATETDDPEGLCPPIERLDTVIPPSTFPRREEMRGEPPRGR